MKINTKNFLLFIKYFYNKIYQSQIIFFLIIKIFFIS